MGFNSEDLKQQSFIAPVAKLRILLASPSHNLAMQAKLAHILWLFPNSQIHIVRAILTSNRFEHLR